MSGICCAIADHERWKYVDEWWRDQKWLGVTNEPEGALVWRNCRTCESTLARHVRHEELVMEAPDGYWVSATGYALLAEEMERAGHLDLAKYFQTRAVDAAEAAFDRACAASAPQLVAIDEVEELEQTHDLQLPNPNCEVIAVEFVEVRA